MNNAARTIAFVVAAAVLTGVAKFSQPDIGEPGLYNDQGQEFFPDFKEAEQAVALEVVTWDDKLSTPRPFRVQLKDGRWTIPSHHDYPADAKKQMSDAAGLLIGLTRDGIRSDDQAQHASFGVVDPMDAGLDNTGRGTLVKMEDASGNEVAALIIGNEVEGRNGLRYVRTPGKKRTYMAKLANVPSTRFEDWIDEKLLEAPSHEITQLVFDNYSIDEATGVQEVGEIVSAKKGTSDWELDQVPEGKEVDQDALRNITYAVGDLKIVGVRQKPEGLSRDLTQATGIQLTNDSVFSLQSRGFYMTRSGDLLSNEGDINVVTKKGVEYKLRFGEILYGEGDTVTAGSASEGKATDDNEGTEGEEGEDALAANRFLMITARFSEDFLDKPTGPLLTQSELAERKVAKSLIEKVRTAITTYKAAHDGAPPASFADLLDGEDAPLKTLEKDPWGNELVLHLTEGDAPVAVITSLGADGVEGGEGNNADLKSDDLSGEAAFQKTYDDTEAFAKKVTEGKELAQKMTQRFAPWYYVISDESFKKLKKVRADLVKDPGEDEHDDEHDDEDFGGAFGPIGPPGG